MKILFMGTSDFAVTCLDALVQAGRTPVAVISQPDKPKGRGYVMTPSPVKAYALERSLPVYTPETLKDGAIADLLKEIDPDLICVVAYGKILPKYVLDYPKYHCVNVHGSLLPMYRGAAPINRAIMAGEKETGVTTMYMAEGLDTGDMLLKASLPIAEDDDFGSVHDKLAVLGGDLLVKTVDALEQGTVVPKPQVGPTCYAAIIDNDTRAVDFSRSAAEIACQIQGLSPMPCAFCVADGKRVKLYKARALPGSPDVKPGTVSENLTVATGDGWLQILELQPEGKKRMSAEDYLRGNKVLFFE